MLVKDIRAAIESQVLRSAWSKGVKAYALELIEDMDGDADLPGGPEGKKLLLNGAEDWGRYSYGGCALICDCDIAERLCSPSELKRTRGGERGPNANEEWLDVQARALSQAAVRVSKIARNGGGKR